MYFFFQRMRLLNKIFFVILFCFQTSYCESTDSCNIVISTQILKSSQITLGYYYGTKTYQKAIIKIDNTGSGIYKNKLHKGIYFIVLPDSSIHEFMIDGKCNLIIDIAAINNKLVCVPTGNPITEAYNTYQLKMNDILSKPDTAVTEQKNQSIKLINTNNERLTKTQQSKISELQNNTVNIYEGSLLQSYLKAIMPVEISDLKERFRWDTANMMQTVNLYHIHYLDNTDLNDSRLLYTPIFTEKIDSYLDLIISQQPDTIVKEIVKMFHSLINQETKSFFIDYETKKYKALSNKAVPEYIYCKLIENIYLKGLTPWVEDVQIIQLRKDYEKRSPVILFQKAPELNLLGVTEKNFLLSEIQSDYTLILFWDVDCPLCTRIIKDLNRTVSAYNYLSIKVFTVCIDNDFERWSGYTIKNLPQTWINTIQLAPTGPSDTYNISRTPSLFLLDKNKYIIQKNFTINELEKILLKAATGKM